MSVLEPGVNVTLYSPDTTGLGFGMDFAIVEDPAAAKTSQGVESFYWGGAFGTRNEAGSLFRGHCRRVRSEE